MKNLFPLTSAAATVTMFFCAFSVHDARTSRNQTARTGRSRSSGEGRGEG